MKLIRFARPLLVSAVFCGIVRPCAAQESSIPAAPVAAVSALDLGSAVEAAVQTAQQTADWQAQLDAARAKRSSGRKIQFSGIGIMFVGFAISAATNSGSCTAYSCSYHHDWFGSVIALGGLVTGIGGGIQAHDADGEVNALIARGPGRMSSLTLPIGDRGGISLGRGREVAIGYRVTW